MDSPSRGAIGPSGFEAALPSLAAERAERAEPERSEAARTYEGSPRIHDFSRFQLCSPRLSCSLIRLS